MTNRLFFLLPAVLCCFNYSIAQQSAPNFTEGFIVYDIKPVGDTELSELYRESTLTLYIKDDKTKFDLKIMGGFAEIQVLDNGKDAFTALMDIPMFSEKVNIPLYAGQDFFNGIQVSEKINKAPLKKAEIELFPKDKSVFLGKSGYKAIVPIIGTRRKAAMYLSNKLNINTPEFLKQYTGELPGLPLQTEITVMGQRIVLTAKEIRRTKINDRVFEVSDDYKIKSVQELRNEMEEFFGGKNSEFGL